MIYNRKIAVFTFLLLIMLSFVYGEAGNFCNGNSPCSCGTNCSGGYEDWNDFNTIDSCEDGPEYTYEYVENITITDLSNSTFRIGDLVSVDGYVDCDPDTDEVTFSYHNTTSWRAFANFNCSEQDKTHLYSNITLDPVMGNHTIRVTIAYEGDANMICGYDYDSVYSDTDDIKFFVLSPNIDITSPSVKNIAPSEGTTYVFFDGIVINITANISDAILVENAAANISWGGKSHIINLYNSNGLYRGNFTNTSDIAKYDINIIAYDNASNINDTENSYFYINSSSNITFILPSEGQMHPSLEGIIYLEITQTGADINSVWVDINGGENIVYPENKKISVEDSSGQGASIINSSNLSQSFYSGQDMYVNAISLKLKKTGTSVQNAILELRNSTFGNPSYLLATSEIQESDTDDSYNWVNLELNSTVLLTGGKSYWLVFKSNGSLTDYFSWEINNDNYAGGNLSINTSIDALFIVYDKYRFNATFSPNDENMDFQAFADTSLGELRSSIIEALFDFEPPEILEYTIDPTTETELDPNSPIRVTANVTDNLEVANVYISYMYENDSDWTNIPIYLIDGLYQGNFTTPYENNAYIKVHAEDTSGNSADGFEDLYQIAYDTFWYIEPPAFNDTGIKIGTSANIENLTLHSDADYGFTVNLSYVSGSNIYFNGTQSMLVNIPSNENVSVIVSADADSNPGESTVEFSFLNLNDTVSPIEYAFSMSLITYLSGPYMHTTITDYDPAVIIGDHISNITARITNLGNETAYNLTARWILPVGWTARGNATRFYENLSSGGFVAYELSISADITESALAGSQEIFFEVNTSGGDYSSDSKTVDVSLPEEENSNSGGGGGNGGSTSSGGPIIIEKPDIYTSLKELKVIRREDNDFIFNIINNETSKKLENVSLSIENIFRNFYKLSPEKIESIQIGENITVNLTIKLPDYFTEGASELRLVVSSDNVEDIIKPFKIIVYDSKYPLTECLDKSDAYILEMRVKGIDISEKDDSYKTAIDNFNKASYKEVKAFCEDMASFYNSFVELENNTNEIRESIEELKKQGYTTSELEKFMDLVEEALFAGRISDASELAKRAITMVESTRHYEKPMNLRMIDFYLANKNALFLFLITFPVFLFLTSRLIYINKTENRIKSLKEEKEQIGSLLRNIQSKFFVDKMLTHDLYSVYIKKYRKRLGEIETKLVKFELFQKNYFKMEKVDLTREKEKIEGLIIQVQEDYFEKKIIDRDSYDNMESTYYSILNNINERMTGRPEEKIEIKPEKEQEIKSEIPEKTEEIKKDIREKNYPEKVLELKEKLKKINDGNLQKINEAKMMKYKMKVDNTKAFYFKDGQGAYSLDEFTGMLEKMDEEFYRFHTSKGRNDFSSWISEVLGIDDLAKYVEECNSIDAIRKKILEYFNQKKE